MTFEEFKTEVKIKLVDRFDFDHEIKEYTVTRNNGIELDGFTIKRKGVNIAPTIYLNSYFDLYNKIDDMDFIVDRIVECYEHSKIETNFDGDSFVDFEKVKDKIIFKLVNTEKNKEFLKAVPHIDYLDLSIIFCSYFEGFEIPGHTSITVRNEHLLLWDKNIDTLMELAINNTPKLLGLSIKSMEDTLAAMMEKQKFDELFSDFIGVPPFYVITNDSYTNGSSTLIYKNLLKNVAERLKADLYIIPCSVNEIIVLPVEENLEEGEDYLKDLIKYVNDNMLDPADILSDNLYFYSVEEEVLSIC